MKQIWYADQVKGNKKHEYNVTSVNKLHYNRGDICNFQTKTMFLRWPVNAIIFLYYESLDSNVVCIFMLSGDISLGLVGQVVTPIHPPYCRTTQSSGEFECQICASIIKTLISYKLLEPFLCQFSSLYWRRKSVRLKLGPSVVVTIILGGSYSRFRRF